MRRAPALLTRLAAALLTPLSPALAAPGEAAVLLCESQESCKGDAHWVRGLEVIGDRELVVVEALLALDAAALGERAPAARFGEAIALAEAEASRGRWRAAEAALDEAEAALEEWAGSPLNEELFALYALRGAALVRRKEPGAATFSFRQAAAVAGVRSPPALPVSDPEIEAAWLDARRLLAVEGEGTLALSGVPEGARVYIDGDYATDRDAALALPPGVHRITAERDDQLRPVVASVPVLAGRTSALALEFPPGESLGAVLDQLDAAFAGQPPPEALVDLLAGWCAQRELSAIQLLRVAWDASAPQPPDLKLTGAASDRPEAADGEPVDMGDGVPITAAGELERRYREGQRAPPPEPYRRLQALWFDAEARRFELYLPPPAPLPPERARVMVGAWGGYAGALERHHAVGAVGLGWRRGSWGLEGRAGLARAGEPYALYPGWSERALWQVYAGPRWSPGWRVAPVVGLGAEVLIPVAVGPRGSAGIEVALGGGWALRAEAGLGWMDGGLSPSGVAGLHRGFRTGG